MAKGKKNKYKIALMGCKENGDINHNTFSPFTCLSVLIERVTSGKTLVYDTNHYGSNPYIPAKTWESSSITKTLFRLLPFASVDRKSYFRMLVRKTKGC